MGTLNQTNKSDRNKQSKLSTQTTVQSKRDSFVFKKISSEELQERRVNVYPYFI